MSFYSSSTLYLNAFGALTVNIPDVPISGTSFPFSISPGNNPEVSGIAADRFTIRTT